jgi:predicted Rossmann fold nucleotide-binding protein DprA/Smf involved in DNA uptake
MNALVAERLSSDEHVALLLCSTLGAGKDGNAAGSAPLKLGEWNDLAQRLRRSALGHPGSLLGLSADDLARQLGLPLPFAERVAHLLDRGTAATLELARLMEWGIWAVTRSSERYPDQIRRKLRDSAPCVLFGSGDITLSHRKAVAIVGSRDVDSDGQRFADCLGSWAARSNLAVASGGARGVDHIAMKGALDTGGIAIGVLADSLQKTVRASEIRARIASSRLLLLTPYHPATTFSVAAAMGRNKVIYALADWAIVVSSSFEQGGTWAGAIETLNHAWTPVYVRDGPGVPKGNRALIERGALEFPTEFGRPEGNLADWLELSSTVHSVPNGANQPRFVRENQASALDSRDGSAKDGNPEPVPGRFGVDSVDRTKLEDPDCLSAEVLGFCSVPRSVQEIADRFKKSVPKVKGFLQPYVDSRRLQRSERPAVRYCIPPTERLL